MNTFFWKSKVVDFDNTEDSEKDELPIDEEEQEEEEEEEERTEGTQKIDVTEETPAKIQKGEEVDLDDWFEPEGELAIDVYQTDKDIVIQSAIAGVNSEELDISLENDVVTIRGVRKNPNQAEEKQYFHEECFWGPFSRQIFLPEQVDIKNVEASIKEGILTLRLPKTEREKTRKVKIAKE